MKYSFISKKQNIILLILALFLSHAYSQADNEFEIFENEKNKEQNDIISEETKNKLKNYSTVALGFGLHNYILKENNITVYDDKVAPELKVLNSYNFYFILEKSFKISKKLNFNIGAGFNYDHLHLKNKFIFNTETETFQYDSNTNYKVMKFNTNYFIIPAKISFKLAAESKFDIGAELKVLTKNKVKQTYEENGLKSKTKTHGNFGASKFGVNILAQLIIKNFGIYGKYSLTPLFTDNFKDVNQKDFNFYPFTIGIYTEL